MASLVFTGDGSPKADRTEANRQPPGQAPNLARRLSSVHLRSDGQETLPISAIISTALRNDPAYSEAKFADFRTFNATIAILLSLFAATLWVYDYSVNPMIAAHTIVYRALFPLVSVPYVASVLISRSSRLSVVCWCFALVAAETLYVEILKQMGGGQIGACGGFIFFLLIPFLMSGSVTLRTNLISLLAMSDWPLMMSAAGLAPGLNWSAYCVTVWPAAGLTTCGLCAFSYIYRMNYEYQQRLLVAASTDPMTGAANRRRFGEALVDAINRTNRYQSPLSVILLDIDHFKRINDQWGHETGDRAICHVVGLCLQAVRDVDLVGRMGGEEFAILLPETNAAAAVTAANRVRALLHDQIFHADDASVIQVRCSFGVASYQSADDCADAVLRRADIALYRAKKAGRDRVTDFCENEPALTDLDID